MFDLGFLELLVIAVIGLLVLGPERLPGVIKQASSWVAKSRYFATNLKEEFEREANLGEIRKSINQHKADLDNGIENLQSGISSLDDSMTGAAHTAPSTDSAATAPIDVSQASYEELLSPDAPDAKEEGVCAGDSKLQAELGTPSVLKSDKND